MSKPVGTSSPWNQVAMAGHQFTSHGGIKIHDTTLRDGEQAPGVAMTKEEKLEVARSLDRAGVHRIEVGMPSVSKEDQLIVSMVRDAGLKAEIFCYIRCSMEDVKLAADLGATGVLVGIPSSDLFITNMARTTRAEQLKKALDVTQYAKSLGLFTCGFCVDASRNEPDTLIEFVSQLAEGNSIDSLGIVDTVGCLSPEGVAAVVKRVRSVVNVPIEIHTHNDYGLATANAISGVVAGASIVHCTVNGLGTRAGNARLEEVVVALRALYGLDLGISLDQLLPLAQQVAALSGMPISRLQPVVGEDLFKIEVASLAATYWSVGERIPEIIFPFAPDLVGQAPPEIVLGKHSGMDSLRYWAERLGLSLEKEQLATALATVKERAMKEKRLLPPDEILGVFGR